MKKIILAFICLVCFTSENMAQYSDRYNHSRSGNWVDDMMKEAPDLYRSYKTGNTLFGAGMGLTLGGLTAAVIGFATADKETTTTATGTQVNLSGSGGAVFAAGMIFTLVGAPMWIIGSVKKKKAKRAFLGEYGDVQTVPVAPSPYLTLHSTANSMGLALIF
jgi:ABC-type uncharacterized transport system permease subunit